MNGLRCVRPALAHERQHARKAFTPERTGRMEPEHSIEVGERVEPIANAPRGVQIVLGRTAPEELPLVPEIQRGPCPLLPIGFIKASRLIPATLLLGEVDDLRR